MDNENDLPKMIRVSSIAQKSLTPEESFEFMKEFLQSEKEKKNAADSNQEYLPKNLWCDMRLVCNSLLPNDRYDNNKILALLPPWNDDEDDEKVDQHQNYDHNYFSPTKTSNSTSVRIKSEDSNNMGDGSLSLTPHTPASTKSDKSDKKSKKSEKKSKKEAKKSAKKEKKESKKRKREKME